MNFSFIFPLIRRAIAGRYRGSFLGMLWAVLSPLFMLAIYTFVFGYVMRARFSVPGTEMAEHSTAQFAVTLFCGLTIYQFFSEVLAAAPSTILNNSNYVKKIVFPIEVLPVVSAGAALFHTAISVVILLVFTFVIFGSVSWTVVLAPVVFAPLFLMTLGFAWVLASVGVYFRDIGQIVPPLLTASMFLSPIFFPRTALPDWLQPYLSLNPLAIPVEALRDVAIFGVLPDWTLLGLYSLAAIVIAYLGYQFFQATRRGFADVL